MNILLRLACIILLPLVFCLIWFLFHLIAEGIIRFVFWRGHTLEEIIIQNDEARKLSQGRKLPRQSHNALKIQG